MLADGGDCLADLGAVRDQAPLFGAVASDATAFRVIDAIARDRAGLERLRAAHARAREQAWELAGAPERLTIDLDVTLLGSPSARTSTVKLRPSRCTFKMNLPSSLFDSRQAEESLLRRT